MTWKTLIPSLLLVFLAQSAAALPTSDALDADVVDDAPASRPIQSPSDPQNKTPVAGAPSAMVPGKERAPSANPLWAIPLSQLSETRDRPIFSVSRRPAALPAAANPVIAKAPPPPKVPERPQLSLVGTIASDDEGFGIFLDQTTKAALRLKVGEDHHGWKLESIRGREVTLQKDQQTSVLSLPAPVGEAGIVRPATLPVLFEGQRK